MDGRDARLKRLTWADYRCEQPNIGDLRTSRLWDAQKIQRKVAAIMRPNGGRCFSLAVADQQGVES